MAEPDICLSSTPVPIDDVDRRVIDVGTRLKHDVEKVLKSYQSECTALDVTINVCGTLDLIRYTKGRKRGYNAVQVQQTDVNFKDLPVNVWL